MKVFGSILSVTWQIFKYFFVPIVFIVGLIITLLMIYFLIFSFRGSRLPKGEHRVVKRSDFLRNLFYYFPMRYIKDFFNRDPEYFKHQGCIIYTGRQGYGKTIAMVEQCRLWMKEYPKALVITNLDFKYEDAKLDTWEKLIDYKNGIYGVICLMDEMQNWFSSNQSKNFPPEMLQVITQNRKNRRVICGTAQSFNRLAKPIREQATEVRKCWTLMGCVTFVHRVIPELDSSGEVIKWHHKGFYYFVHTDELRDSYDTYKCIESLRQSGFQDKPTILTDSFNI
jgi:hypothetical protein